MDNVSDHYGLTGCVTLYNVNIKNSSFKIKNSFCEDAINFIRTNGNIKNIEIINSISDALDVDFSNLILNKVEILSAKMTVVIFRQNTKFFKLIQRTVEIKEFR